MKTEIAVKISKIFGVITIHLESHLAHMRHEKRLGKHLTSTYCGISCLLFWSICTGLCQTILNLGMTEHGYSYYLHTTHEWRTASETVVMLVLNEMQLLLKLNINITYCSIKDALLASRKATKLTSKSWRKQVIWLTLPLLRFKGVCP